MITTISSDGKVRLYDLAALPLTSDEKTQLEPIAEYDTKGTRLTCLTMAEGDETVPMNGKRKRDDEEMEEEEDADFDLQEEDGEGKGDSGSDEGSGSE